MNQWNLVLEWTEPNEFEDEHDEYSTSRRSLIMKDRKYNYNKNQMNLKTRMMNIGPV